MTITDSIRQRQAREPEYEHFVCDESDEPEGTFICDNCGDVVQGFRKVDPSIQDQEGWHFAPMFWASKCCESTYFESEDAQEGV